MTLISPERGNMCLVHQPAADDDVQASGFTEQRIPDNLEQQIAYCQKYRELLSNKDQLFVDDLAGREATPSSVRYLSAITAAIFCQRDCPAIC
jgi:hypothetical protein